MAKKVNADSENKQANLPETDVIEQSTKDEAVDEQAVVKIKGVSGKTITGVVRVVKAKRKPKAASSEAETVSESMDATPAVEAVKQTDEIPTDNDVKSTDSVDEGLAVPKPIMPSGKKKGNVFADAKKANIKEMSSIPTPLNDSDGSSIEQAVHVEEMNELADKTTDSTNEQSTQLQDAPVLKDERAETLTKVSKVDAEKTASPKKTDKPKMAEKMTHTESNHDEQPSSASISASADAKTNTKIVASSSPSVSKPAKKPLGKVGNIFDRSSNTANKSSLAATVQAHADRMNNKNKPKHEGRGSGRARNGQGGQGDRQVSTNQRYQSRPSGNGNFAGGYGGKDKDDDVNKNRNKRPARRPMADSAPVGGALDLFGSGKTSRDNNRHNRGNQDNKKRDYDREGGRLKRGIRERGGRDESYYEGHHRRSSKKEAKPKTVQHTVLTHVSLPEQITVKEFAEAIKKTSSEVIKSLMMMGVMATINQVIDYDTASIIAGEFNITTDQLIEVTEEDILFDDSEDQVEDLEVRPPVVVVMGHVDHGKTSLLDFYRNSSVVSGEAGGITQHIGAYTVQLNDRRITFLDTPGHEAFTTMRARGAMVTDIAILVVAADDGVMPQTIEAINHAKMADTQVIVAINKIDKEGTNIDRVKQELAKYDLIPEEWGGTTIMVPVSAKTGQGMDELLEMVLLTADVLELKANPNRQAKGTVIEAKLDKNRGPVATLLIQRGTLHAGETVVTGSIVGNVRAMTDANGKRIKEAGPSVPVEIIGLPEVPEAGEIFYGVKDDRMAKQLAEKRRIKQREDEMKKSSRMSLDNLYKKMAEGEVKDLNIIVKADVQGSVEAVKQSLERLSNDEVKVRVIHGAVGAVTETDLRLAEVSNAIVIGFNVRPAVNVEDMAKEIGIDMRLYRVIYNAIEDIEDAMKGLLDPEFEEVSLGMIELREVFKISSVGTVGGGYVTNGKITRNAQVRVVRDGIVIAEDQVASLRRFKDDVREVAQGYECGITLERFHDLKEGDQIEAFEMREIERN